jgi:hypothetical protein
MADNEERTGRKDKSKAAGKGNASARASVSGGRASVRPAAKSKSSAPPAAKAKAGAKTSAIKAKPPKKHPRQPPL